MKPTSIDEVQEAVQSQPRCHPKGAGTKPALSRLADDILAETATLDLSSLAGVLAYDPGEYTFTALAGTPVSTVNHLLAENGQYLPFDPMLATRGATLGGLVASGTAGPGRYRFGGVRDFLIGIQFVDGQGKLVRGGGKVVKNSAGFDLPKLMVGSLGRLGVLVELTFKVFPQPETYATLQVDFDSLPETVVAMQQLTTSYLEMDALDLLPSGRLWIRLGGMLQALPDRLARLQRFLQAKAGNSVTSMQVIEGETEAAIWTEARELALHPEGWHLIKVPLTPSRLLTLEDQLEGRSLKRHYSVGGNVGWLASPTEQIDGVINVEGLDTLLAQLDLSGLAIFGSADQPFLGRRFGDGLLKRIKQALDPDHRFLAY